jgi:hypothetical protein
MVKNKIQIGKNLVFYDFLVIKFRFLFLFWKIARFYPNFYFYFHFLKFLNLAKPLHLHHKIAPKKLKKYLALITRVEGQLQHMSLE